MGGNQSGTDQVFMGSQEGLAGQGQRGDSQGRHKFFFAFTLLHMASSRFIIVCEEGNCLYGKKEIVTRENSIHGYSFVVRYVGRLVVEFSSENK